MNRMTQLENLTTTESSPRPYRVFKTGQVWLLTCFLSATAIFAEPFLFRATGTVDPTKLNIPGTTADFVFEIVLDNGGASTADQTWNGDHFVSATLTSGTYVMNWTDCTITSGHLNLGTDSASQVTAAGTAIAINGYYCQGGQDNFGSVQPGQNTGLFSGYCAASGAGEMRDTMGRQNTIQPSFCQKDTDFSNWSQPVPVPQTVKYDLNANQWLGHLHISLGDTSCNGTFTITTRPDGSPHNATSGLESCTVDRTSTPSSIKLEFVANGGQQYFGWVDANGGERSMAGYFSKGYENGWFATIADQQ